MSNYSSSHHNPEYDQIITIAMNRMLLFLEQSTMKCVNNCNYLLAQQSTCSIFFGHGNKQKATYTMYLRDTLGGTCTSILFLIQ